MRLLFLIIMNILITSCASFPVPSVKQPLICSSKRNNHEYSIQLKPNEMGEIDNQDQKFIEAYNQQLTNTGCFSPDKNISKTKINNKIIFEFKKSRIYTEYYIMPGFSFITLGIIPSWSKIITTLRVVKQSDDKPELEIFNITQERYQVLSIFMAPIGLYGMISAPTGFNAIEASQLETNQYLINEALNDLNKNGHL